MDLPTFSEATDAASDAAQEARTLIPWLPDPPQCPGCGTLQSASETFDPDQALYVTSWYCPECDQHRYREPEYGEDVVEGPQSGATQLQELLNDR